MRRFAKLYEALDSTTSINRKVAALVEYFRNAPAADAAWAVYFLTGRRLKRLVTGPALRQWTLELTELDEWIFDESYNAVGDGAETMALLVDLHAAPNPDGEDLPLAAWVEERLLPLRNVLPEAQGARVKTWLASLERTERFMLAKLLTGEFRVGVSDTLVVRALAEVAAVEPAAIAHRLMGDWEPTAERFAQVVSAEHTRDDESRPYPFFLASPLEGDPETLGDLASWQVEWKWDGIRAQLVRRGGNVYLWSRGEDLITTRFPEIAAAATTIAGGTVLDGEVLAWRGDRPLPFSDLQQRIGRRRNVGQMTLAAPAVFMAYDLLEERGEDIRERPQAERRQRLEALLASRTGDSAIRVSPLVHEASWPALASLREQARDRGVEGFMLKARDSAYGTGRRKGPWWKWKIAPLTIDAVLIYAQPGSGKRASLLTDYTFGLWSGEELVPVAKAYSGLSNDEIAELDKWIRAHTRERFGPVRHVEPEQVFELGFEAVAHSTRHKSGVAVRFPRMLRWRRDKTPKDADTVESLKALIR